MEFFYRLRACLTLLAIILNTIILVCVLYIFTLVKLLLPVAFVRRPINRILALIAELWIGINNASIRLFSRVKLNISGIDNLSYRDWYLVTSNHQSWADILILQMTFNRRIPLLKFFLKQELIKVPFLGLAWWALDFPFMKRYSKAEIEANPSLKGKDLETTQRACQKFMEMPTSVMNFFEGTRFTRAKHDQQQSPYKHLLKPKAGGTAFALSAMQGQLKTLLDVTLIYPPHAPTSLMAFLGGHIDRVDVIVTQREIPVWAAQGDYENDANFRSRFQTWISNIWAAKDTLIDKHHQ
jgi:1-acyl-sn-glycerol-3-phosphate acyltransferase